MVVILHEHQYDEWLTAPPEKSKDFMRQYPAHLPPRGGSDALLSIEALGMPDCYARPALTAANALLGVENGENGLKAVARVGAGASNTVRAAASASVETAPASVAMQFRPRLHR